MYCTRCGKRHAPPPSSTQVEMESLEEMMLQLLVVYRRGEVSRTEAAGILQKLGVSPEVILALLDLREGA